MFSFISIIVCLLSLYYLGTMVGSNSLNTEYTMPPIILLIYSIVALMRELKLNDDEYFTYNNSGRQANNRGCYDNEYYNYNVPTGASSVVRSYRTVETFKDDKQERKKEDRPLVLHYPSQKEAREKIAELEQSWWWRVKKNFAAFFSYDITAKYYQPRYIREEVAVKGKEDNSRYMPNNSFTYRSSYEDAEYNKVAKLIGRSCDIAMGNEEFVQFSQGNCEIRMYP